MTSDLATAAAEHTWYHTIDLGDGVVTPGMFDHRPAVQRYGLPEDLGGLRCLDVGTMDGYWAFEMERRGAIEVMAIDVEDPAELDWPWSLRHLRENAYDDQKQARFELVRAALDSRVERRLVPVQALADGGLGSFDLVFCGDLLVHLKDPMTALEQMRAVCRGRAIVCTPIVRTPFLRSWRRQLPVVQFDGIDEFQWWLPSLSALERMVRAAGFSRTDTGTPFELPATSGGRWKGLRGVVAGWV